MAIFDTDINKLFTGDLALYKATRKNRKYWRERSEILEQALHDDVMRSYENVVRGFSVAARELESSIADWYMRFAQSGSMSLTEARKLLSASELDELKWTVGEYIEYAKEHGADLRWIDKLERASAKAHISRLEALQLNAQNAIEKAFAREHADVDAAVRSAYRNGYYGESFLVQKGLGAGFNVAAIDADKLDKLISTPWTFDKRTFSSRIWDRRDKVVSETQQLLTRACITGENPVSLADQLSKSMGVESRNAKRLLQTEGAYFAAAGEKASYQECGITDYEFVATLDSRTSEICREMDGRVFKVTQYDSGLNAPPMHVNCRSTTVAYFPDEEELAERIAKTDGGYERIPATMKYKEWYKQHVVPAEAKTTKGIAGLGASNEISDPSGVLKIEELGTVSSNKRQELNRDEINSYFKQFEEDFKDSPYESAIIVIKDGTVLRVTSNEPADVDLRAIGDRLEGSIIHHNHPKERTWYSLSIKDLWTFTNNEIQELSGFDDKFRYKVTRTAKTKKMDSIEQMETAWDEYYRDVFCQKSLEELVDPNTDEYHVIMECFAKRLGFKYERFNKNS